MLFVYLLENNPEYAPRVQRLYGRMIGRHDRLVTSTFTVAELLVAPCKTGDKPLAEAIREFLYGPDVDLIPFERQAAEAYAEVRAKTGVRPADAIHLACAAGANTDIFVTNDRSLHGMTAPGIQFIATIEVAESLLGPLT